MPKNARRKSIRQPFRWPSVRSRSIDQPLALMEHRRVGGVVVGAIGAAGHDRPGSAAAASAWCGSAPARCACAAPAAARCRCGGQIERVVVARAGMVRRNVQRAEIAPVALDVRTFGDGEAHGAEDRRDFLHGAADRVDQPGRRAAAAAGCGSIRSCASRASSAAASSAALAAPRCAGVSASFSRFSAAPRSRRCSGGVLPRSLSSPVSAAVAAEHGDADGVPGAQIGRRRRAPHRSRSSGLEIVGHRCVACERAALGRLPGAQSRTAPSVIGRLRWPRNQSKGDASGERGLDLLDDGSRTSPASS